MCSLAAYVVAARELLVVEDGLAGGPAQVAHQAHDALAVLDDHNRGEGARVDAVVLGQGFDTLQVGQLVPGPVSRSSSGGWVVEGRFHAAGNHELAVVAATSEGVVELLEVNVGTEEEDIGAVVGEDLGGVAHAIRGEADVQTLRRGRL